MKASLRQNLLREIDSPVVLEAFGGYGSIFRLCYNHIESGIVFEKDPRKISHLAKQRPTWAVYQSDCVEAMREGVGSHLIVNFLDCDPYGDPWPAIDAFLFSQRPFPDRLAVAVTDGLRIDAKVSGLFGCESMAMMVERHGGAHVYSNYVDVCRELLAYKASQIGYDLRRWSGYYCGAMQQITHYAAILER